MFSRFIRDREDFCELKTFQYELLAKSPFLLNSNGNDKTPRAIFAVFKSV